MTYTLSGTDAALFNISSTGEVYFKSRPDFEAPVDANGDNVYQFDLTVTDANAHTYTRNVSLSVTNAVETATAYRVGQSMIDLGGYGRLIKPVHVDGKWYYFWDRSGDGSSGNAGNAANVQAENQGIDTVDHNTLDKLFRYAGDFTTANPGSFGADTTNTYRYATLNGVKVALPTYGGPVDANGNSSAGGTYRNGTVIDNQPIGEANPTYDDLLAIWDAFNGGRDASEGRYIGWDIGGLPPGWANSAYHSATKAADGSHQLLAHPSTGVTSTAGDAAAAFVALEVIGTFAAIGGASGMSNGVLVAGSVVTASVYFSDAVTTTGTPSLKLSVGGQQVNASYAAGMGTNKLDFTYTVQAGQNDADGIVIVQDGLSVAGGTLNRVAGGTADIAIAHVNPNGFYKVDATAPVLDLNGAVAGNAMTSFYGAKSMLGVVLRGVDEYVDMPDLTLGGSMTFEARVRTDSFGNFSRLWDYGDGAGNNNLLYAVTNGVPGPTQPAISFFGTLPGNPTLFVGSTQLNQWWHVAVVVQAPTVVGGVVTSNGFLNIYNDGILISSTSITSASQIIPTVTRINSFLGRSNWNSDSFLDGSIADFRIYNRARTAAEVASDSLGIVDTSDTSLVAYHSFASSADSGLAGQSAGALMNGAFVGGVTANRVIVYDTSAISQVRVTMAGMLDGAAEKLTIQGTQVSLDGAAATGSVTLDTDVWNWSATGNIFTFTLASGNASATQTDKLVQSLGYLNTQATPSEGNRTMSFVITDAAGLQSAATVHTITVDNTAPVFADASPAALTLSEVSATSGASLLSVSATDASTTAGGKIAYRLTGNDANRFAVDASGKVTLRQTLDFEAPVDSNADNVYQFTVNAVDEAGNFSGKDVSLTVQNAVESLDLDGASSALNLVYNYNQRSQSVLNFNPWNWGNCRADLPSLTLGGAMTIETQAWLDGQYLWHVPIGFARADGNMDIRYPADKVNLSSGLMSHGLGMYMAPDNSPLKLNSWNHLAYVWGEDGTFSIYVNGKLSVSWAFRPVLPDAATQIVFGNNPQGDRPWVGSMREFRVYDDARSVAEIQADMMGVIDLSDSQLKAYYSLDGRSTASSISGQASLTLGSEATTGRLAMLDRVSVSSGNTAIKIRISFSGISDGASEKLLIANSVLDLDSSTAGSGTVTVGADSWSWTRSGSTLVFTTATGTDAKLQALLSGLNYRNDAVTVTDGDRGFAISLLTSSDTVVDTQTLTVKVDLTAPVFGAAADTTTLSVAENTTASTVVFNGNATDASGSVTYTLSGVDAERFSISNTGAVTFKNAPDFENARDVDGNNVYNFNVTATDANGNSSHKSVALTVTDVASDTAGYQSPKGQSVIDLGSFGKLILPVEVNGKTFYYWDRSGDGTINNGGQNNAGVDFVDVPSQAAVNGLFKFASDFTTQNSGTQPTNAFRFATLNGVRVALPTFDGEDQSNGSINYALTTQQTRHADPGVTNEIYDDMLAIWDAYNGVRTGSAVDSAAKALGWTLDSYYLTATTADNGANLMVHMNPGHVYSTGLNAHAYSVALQVL